MNPYDEQRLRDEVIYLHSLWHRGPPNEHPKAGTHIPTNPTPFKKQKLDPSPVSGPEWPVDPPPSPPSATSTGWPELKPKAPKETGSEQDQAKLLALQVQNKAVDGCRRFFSKRVDEEESDEEEDDDSTESKEYRFLLDIFVNDGKLRDYYEKHHESGEFCCLVCGGIGEKVNKKYKDCVGLVQHANGVSKTKRKRAHRALGRIVCNVLGWDFDRLPVVVLKGQPLGRSLANSSSTQGNDENDKLIEGSMTENNSELADREVLNVSQKDGEMKVSENPLKVDDSSIVDAKVSNMEADKEVAVERQESSQLSVASNSWSCIEPVDELSPIASGWPTMKPKKPLVIQLASAEDQAKLAAVILQHKASEACQEFFEKNAGSEGDDEEDNIMDEDDRAEDYLIDEDESGDSEDFKFILKLFAENSELRNYYEKNFEAGDFCCLVCGGIGKNVWKRFKDCLGLLQHSTAISKKNKKHAHRAFGQVVCKVLGWDIDRLPTIVSKGEPLGQSLTKLDALQNPSRKDDSIKDVNDTYPGILDVEGNKEGAADVLVPQESDGTAN